MIFLKRKLLLLYVFILGLFLISCSKGGIYIGSRDTDFPGYLQMKLDEKEYDLGKTILLHASYGHNYTNFNKNNSVLKNTISIYTIGGNTTGGVVTPSEYIEFYEVSYEGEDLGSDIYRCYPGSTLFTKVKYNMTVDLNLDLSEVEYDSGLLVMRFAEDFMNQNIVEGVLIETEVVHYVYTFLYFLKNDTTIQFSKTSFA